MIDPNKRSVILIVCNGAPFLRVQLEHIYPVVDEIVVVEGADPTFQKIIKSKRSTDGTIEIVKRFPDPAKKIRMTHTNCIKNDMVKVGNSMCTGGLIYQCDVDEFIPHPTINEAFGILKNGVDCVGIPQRWYYKWPDTYLSCRNPFSVHWSPVRFFQNHYDKGFAISHIPPDGYKRLSNGENVSMNRYNIDNSKYAYHFLALFRNSLQAKLQYYKDRDRLKDRGVVLNRIREFDLKKRSDIGKPVPSYDPGFILKVEERPFPVRVSGGFLRWQ